ncbi:MAG: PH domain-containing protein [Actinomycetota bacterium]|nr:PH domain-containing protein [Actinomycetota bacterium]
MSGAEPGFTRVHPLSPFLRGGLVLVALAVTGGRQLAEGGGVGWPWWLVPVVFVASLASAGVSWWFTRYRVGADELRLDSGVLARRSRRVRLDRIQAIEVQQPFLARIFGMASLDIETAGGGSDSEVTLAYLSLRRATDLRRHLLVEAGREGGLDRAETQNDDDELLHRVTPGLLLASQLLRTGPVLAALSAMAAATVAGVGSAAGVPGVVARLTSPAAGVALSLTVLVPALLAVVTAVGKGFVEGYGFAVRRSAGGLSVRAGMFGVGSAALPVQRIRGLVITEPIVWRWLGWVALDVTVAGVAVRPEQDRRLATTLVPVARRADARRLVAQVLPGLDLDALPVTGPPAESRWVDPLARRVLGMGVDEVHVLTRRGLLTRRTDIAPVAAVQSRGLRQGVLQRWLGLATVDWHLPSGPASPVAPHRRAEEAWQLMLGPGPPPPSR